MRMWNVDPSLLCKQHLLGEHGEIHKHRHNFVKKHKIDGRMSPIVQIEPSSMQSRHDELANEMLRRGMDHKSPYIQPDISYLPESYQRAKVDVAYSVYDLGQRCEHCRHLIEAYNK